MDELPEFSRAALEVLRQPLEDGEVSINRVQAAYVFPAHFLLCCAQNPCPCGYLGDASHPCKCRQADIERYRRKISGPLLDRIDLQVQVPRVEIRDLQAKSRGETSAAIRRRVCAARRCQEERLRSVHLHCNSQMSHREVETFCLLNREGRSLLEKAFTALGLSARSYDRIIKVSRTIADLDGDDQISAAAVAEAIQLRTGASYH